MSTCHTCGNAYEKTFTVLIDNRSYDFDSFECAIHALAPTCSHCGCRVLGHGMQSNSAIFCCANCAMAAGVTGLADHVNA